METRADVLETPVVIEEEKKEMSTSEVCFGALMALAAICGMWGITSILIRLFVGA